jgi:colanic acid/amylovoran biosynthesis glycosyltransferase
MESANTARVGYVLKMYPRFSETFILNEILAHQVAGLELAIFSLRAPNDGRFHAALAEVRAPVSYLPYTGIKAQDLWNEARAAAEELPGFWPAFAEARHEADVRDVYQAIALARQARAQSLTHLHAHFASAATTVARLAARFAELPYSFTAHAKDIFHESVAPEDLGRKLADAAGVITVSDYNAAFLCEAFPSAALKVLRVYNGLDLERFRYRSPEARPARIICVGRLVEKKGIDVLVAACALLRDQGRRFECLIVGGGPLEPALRRQIDELDLHDYVELTGPQPQELVRELVQGAAAFAAPCVIGADGNRDGLPTVLLEAMALGTPCVSTDVTGIPELLHDGRSGLLVGQHDQGALAQALGKLLQDPALRVRLAERARDLIEAQFDIRASAKLLREVFSAPQHALALGGKVR